MIGLAMPDSGLRGLTIGERIRSERETRGWSQSDLSIRARVPQATIHKIESGKTVSPRMDTLQALAETFGVPIGELTGEIPLAEFAQSDDWIDQLIRRYAPNVPPDLARQVVGYFDKLDAHGRKAAIQMLRALAEGEAEEM